MALPLTGAEAQLINSEYPYTTEVDAGDDKLNHRVEVHGAGLAEAVDTVSKALRVTETDPARFAMVSESLGSDDLAVATHYLPSSDGVSMLGFKSLSVTGELTTSGTTSTLTLEVRNTTTGSWISVGSGLEIRTNSVKASITNADGLFAWDFDDLSKLHFRLKLVIDNATNTNEIDIHRTPV